jgi:serine protease inhibitor
MRTGRWTRLAASMAVVVVGSILAACGSAGSTTLRGDAAHLDADRVGGVAEQDVLAVAAGMNAFGFDLQRALVAEMPGANVVTSPLSAASLLALVGAGAGGQTAAEIAEVLGIGDLRSGAVGALLLAISDTDDVAVTIASSVWADRTAPLDADYLSHVAGVLGATAEEVDLDDPEVARRLDGWVSERTDGLIPGIAADLGLPDPAAVMVLLNAVHFEGEWSTTFDEGRTRSSTFTRSDGSRIEVPTMVRPASAGLAELAERDGYDLLRLPYGDDQRFGMEVYLPSVDRDLGWLVGHLDAEERLGAVADLTPRAVDIRFPRLELEWSAELIEPLGTLGLRQLFGRGADLSRMSPAIHGIDVVVQKTYLRVDEQGTVAAAVTGGASVTSSPPTFTVDRPFVLAITDRATGAVLFLGSVEDPSA